MKRTVKKIHRSQKVNMGGIILDQPLPHRELDMVDPFLLIHHWANTLPGGQKQNNLGVGPHPHRGFTPVTFIFKGGVHHRDSTGHESVVYAGGTQWMNSGKGIVHSERPAKEIAENGGDFELIQFWVNAPSKHKMDAPAYKPLSAEQTPVVTSQDGLVKTAVVSGTLDNVTGKLLGNSDLLTLRLDVQKGGKTTLNVPKHFNALMYVLDGHLTVNGTEAGDKNLVTFENDGDEIEVEGMEHTRAIILSGAPINEPVVSYGPFVMNTEQEIMQAIQDYQSGKMGILTENFDS